MVTVMVRFTVMILFTSVVVKCNFQLHNLFPLNLYKEFDTKAKLFCQNFGCQNETKYHFSMPKSPQTSGLHVCLSDHSCGHGQVHKFCAYMYNLGLLSSLIMMELLFSIGQCSWDAQLVGVMEIPAGSPGEYRFVNIGPHHECLLHNIVRKYCF